ncbi:hypothetical protein SALBM217S_10902 [Streptomyces griseoloalbus]
MPAVGDVHDQLGPPVVLAVLHLVERREQRRVRVGGDVAHPRPLVEGLLGVLPPVRAETEQRLVRAVAGVGDRPDAVLVRGAQPAQRLPQQSGTAARTLPQAGHGAGAVQQEQHPAGPAVRLVGAQGPLHLVPPGRRVERAGRVLHPVGFAAGGDQLLGAGVAEAVPAEHLAAPVPGQPVAEGGHRRVPGRGVGVAAVPAHPHEHRVRAGHVCGVLGDARGAHGVLALDAADEQELRYEGGGAVVHGVVGGQAAQQVAGGGEGGPGCRTMRSPRATAPVSPYRPTVASSPESVNSGSGRRNVVAGAAGLEGAQQLAALLVGAARQLHQPRLVVVRVARVPRPLPLLPVPGVDEPLPYAVAAGDVPAAGHDDRAGLLLLGRRAARRPVPAAARAGGEQQQREQRGRRGEPSRHQSSPSRCGRSRRAGRRPRRRPRPGSARR